VLHSHIGAWGSASARVHHDDAESHASDPRSSPDEPTTALDLTSRPDVVGSSARLRREWGGDAGHLSQAGFGACRLEPHRLHVCQRDRRGAARGPAALGPLHPYSAFLVAARPTVDQTVGRFPALSGRPNPTCQRPIGPRDHRTGHDTPLGVNDAGQVNNLCEYRLIIEPTRTMIRATAVMSKTWAQYGAFRSAAVCSSPNRH